MQLPAKRRHRVVVRQNGDRQLWVDLGPRSLHGCHRARKSGKQQVTARTIHESKRVGTL